MKKKPAVLGWVGGCVCVCLRFFMCGQMALVKSAARISAGEEHGEPQRQVSTQPHIYS